MTPPAPTSKRESTERVITAKRFVVSRIVSERALILDTSRDDIKQLNEVASFIWSLVLKSKHSRDDMLSAIVKNFDVTLEIASIDLDHFLSELNKAGLIEYID